MERGSGAAPLRAVGGSDEMVRGKSSERCLYAALSAAVLVLSVHLGICTQGLRASYSIPGRWLQSQGAVMSHTQFSRDTAKRKGGSVRPRDSRDQRGKERGPTLGLMSVVFPPHSPPYSPPPGISHVPPHLRLLASLCTWLCPSPHGCVHWGLSPSGRLRRTPGVQRETPGPGVLGDGALCPAWLPRSLHQPLQVLRLDPANHSELVIASVREYGCPAAAQT